MEEARAAKDELLRPMPHDNRRFVRSNSFSTIPDRMNRMIDGLRKAGMPE